MGGGGGEGRGGGGFLTGTTLHTPGETLVIKQQKSFPA